MRLTLKTEHLADLTPAELERVAGADALSGLPDCKLPTLRDCTLLDCLTGNYTGR